jgi:hypothetical protein
MLSTIRKIRDDLAWEKDNIHDNRPVMQQLTQDKIDSLDSMAGLLEDASRLEQIEAMLDARSDAELDRQEQLEAARDNYEPPDPPGFEGGFADNH